MANVERDVKGEKFTRRNFLKSALTGLTMAGLGLNRFDRAWGQQPDFTPPHPYSGDSSTAKTELTWKETDPYSQEGLLENFVAGYALMNDEDKQEIKKQVFTHESGATVFLSKRTANRLASSSPTLGMKIDNIPLTFTANTEEPSTISINLLAGYVARLESFSWLPIGPESFVVIDEDGKNQTFILWTMKNTSGYYALCNDTTVYRNDQELSLPKAFLKSDPPWSTRLTPFAIRPSWDDNNSQFIYADEVSIFADLHLDKVNPNDTELQFTTREIPTLLGAPVSRLKANFKRYLKLTEPWKPLTVFFSHPEEVRRYLVTGDPNDLTHIELLPNEENPAFFINAGSDQTTYGFDDQADQAVRNIIKKNVQTLQEIDPTLLTTLNQWGFYTLIPDTFPGDFPGGIKTITAYTRMNKEKIREIEDISLVLMLTKAHQHYFRKMLAVQREGLNINPSPLCDSQSEKRETFRFLQQLAHNHQKDMSSRLYNILVQEADSYLRQRRNPTSNLKK